MQNKIKSISFLYKGSRIVVEAKLRGTFRIPHTSQDGRKTTYKNLTAKEMVEHEIIKDCDPVITLHTGEKIRVYQGGVSGYIPAIVDGLLVKHDKKENDHRESQKNKIKFNSWSSARSEEQYELPWEDLGYYDDRN